MLSTLFVVGAVALAQLPDRRGEAVLDRPEYRGQKLADPIDPRHHVHNEGGSDGAGLCVISSVLANGQHVGIDALAEGKGSLLWRTAKIRPGGYGPEKLAALVRETVPGEKFISVIDTNPSVLDRVSRQGYKIGATMNTGALYRYRPIHHMISLDRYRTGGLAWVVDNNKPGYWSVMPATEYDRRWIDGGMGWLWIWTRKPAVRAVAAAAGSSLAITFLALAALFAALGKARRLNFEGGL